MGYDLLDEGTFADVAVKCDAETLETLFKYNAEALVAIILKNTNDIKGDLTKEIRLQAEEPDLLLLDFMNELIYQKDVNNLLLLPGRIQIERKDDLFSITASMRGDRISKKCSFVVDVKAATMHELKVSEEKGSWNSFMILDV